MGRKHQKAAASRARANRHKPTPSSPPREIPSEPVSANPTESFVDGIGDLASNPIDVDWEWDCGYNGGVNREDSETEYRPGTSSNEESDGESLDEFSGDELEQNLQQQRELLGKAAALTRPTPYSQITHSKTKAEWTKAEQNRALGYNGHSKCTMRRKDQEARERDESRNNARTS